MNNMKQNISELKNLLEYLKHKKEIYPERKQDRNLKMISVVENAIKIIEMREDNK